MPVRIERFYPNICCPDPFWKRLGRNLPGYPTGRIAIVPDLHVVVRVIP